jgi:hypothetical protein
MQYQCTTFFLIGAGLNFTMIYLYNNKRNLYSAINITLLSYLIAFHVIYELN